MELRLAAYRRAYPNVHMLEVRLEELETRPGLEYLGLQLGHHMNRTRSDNASHIGRKENRHVARLDEEPPPEEVLRRQITAWLGAYEALGWEVPLIPGRKCLGVCKTDKSHKGHGR
mmetsp:Transcript_15737/g.61464  ORF Transcript_15737/g.61464 Transcript_15737/m.61464 type:complete len:116 (+) Transcript_15737:611-958(+)